MRRKRGARVAGGADRYRMEMDYCCIRTCIVFLSLGAPLVFCSSLDMFVATGVHERSTLKLMWRIAGCQA